MHMKRTETLIITVSMVAVFTLVGASGILAQEDPEARPFYFSASIGLNKPSLGDVNDYLESTESIFESASWQSVSWDQFTWTPALGAEFGKQVSPTVFIGLAVSYQKNAINNSYSNVNGSLSYDPEYQLIDISGRVRIVPKTAQGFFFGFSGGLASGKFEEVLIANIIADPSQNVDVVSEYTGAGLSLGGFAGYELSVGKTTKLTGQIGYRYRNLGTFDGYTKGVIAGDEGRYDGPALDNSGKKMDFDFSGFHIDVGVVFFFGG